MAWVKANIALLISSVVALALLAGSVVFLMSKAKAKAAVMTELDSVASKYNSLAGKKVTPTDDNIELTAQEYERVQKVVDTAIQQFGEVEIPEQLDWSGFKAFLESSIFELTTRAEASGVALPADFSFTFDEQRTAATFPTASLEPMSYQLAEIRSLMEIMFDAKVHSVLGIRRAAIDSVDTSGRNLLPQTFTTNSTLNAIISPYEIAIECFSSELAKVLTGLTASEQCWIAKTVTVTPADAPMPRRAMNPMASAYGMEMPGGMDEELAARYGFAASAQEAQMEAGMAAAYGLGGGSEMASRYGMGGGEAGMAAQYGMGGGAAAAYGGRYGGGGGGRYGGGGGYGGRYGMEGYGMQPMMPAAPRSRGGLETILNEEPLRATIKLNMVRLIKPKENTQDAAAPPVAY